LHAGCTYDFYVQAAGLLGGVGPSSECVSIQIGDAAPAHPPGAFRIVESTLDEILVSWDPPPVTPGCTVTGYR
jgi:hypothetical protein